MGRRKISINPITDPKLRNITYFKRRHGLIKKAAELSLLCNVNMLLIFEDGNGNLIQFSRNKITTIPSFFKECTYSSVSEFTTNDYPNFFNADHKKKRRQRKNEEDSNKQAMTEEGDEFPVLEDVTLLIPDMSSSQKGENFTTSPESISEDPMSPGMVSYPSSEEQNHNGSNGIETISDIQLRELNCDQSRQSQCMMEKTGELGSNYLEEQEAYLNKTELSHNYKDIPLRGSIMEERPADYIQPRIPNKRPVKRLNLTEDWPHFNRNYYFGPNMPLYADYPDYHSTYGPYYDYNDPYLHRTQNFGHSMPGPRAFRQVSDEEAVDHMFRFSPQTLGRSSSDPYANNSRPSRKAERNEFANYVDHNYQEINPHHHRGAYYAYGDNRTSSPEENMPATYFSSRKFNLQRYENHFEGDSFNEFSDPQKKLKQ